MVKEKGVEDARGQGYKGSRIEGVKDPRGQRVTKGGDLMLKNYKELKVWAVSVPSNIAEGYGRKTTPEYIHSLYIAYGSNCELETQLLLSGDLGYLNDADRKRVISGIGEIERMLQALIKRLKEKISRG
jgi:four helix bundle protein